MSDARDRLSALLGQVGAGRSDALKAVYDFTSAKMFGICLRVTGDRMGAEEAMQDAYVKNLAKGRAVRC